MRLLSSLLNTFGAFCLGAAAFVVLDRFGVIGAGGGGWGELVVGAALLAGAALLFWASDRAGRSR